MVHRSTSLACDTTDAKAKPIPQTDRDQSFDILRAEFHDKERVLADLVEFDKLSSTELAIHSAHDEAVKQHLIKYDDPATGKKVFTRFGHFNRGKCCGNACRHVST